MFISDLHGVPRADYAQKCLQRWVKGVLHLCSVANSNSWRLCHVSMSSAWFHFVVVALWLGSSESECPSDPSSLRFSSFDSYSSFPVDTGVLSTEFADASFTMIASVYLHDPVPGSWTCWLGNTFTWPFVNSGHLQLCLTSTKLKFGFYSNDLDANYVLPHSTWTRITAVYDATSFTQSLYVNCDLVGTRGTSSHYKGQDPHNVKIGLKYNTADSFGGKGEIRNVLFYMEALGPADLDACAVLVDCHSTVADGLLPKMPWREELQHSPGAARR